MSKVKDFVARHPVFTRREFENYVHSDGERSKWTIKNMLAQHMDAGRIGRVRQGLYYSIPEGRDPETFQPNPYLVASRVREDAVIGYHSAVQYHGHAHFVHHRCLFLTNDPPRPFEFRGTEYKAVRFPASLRKQDREAELVEDNDVEGLTVPVTTLERTLVDCLDRPELAGGWESIWRSFSGIGYLKIDQIIDYTKLLDNKTTAAKVGFYLDQHRDALSLRDGDLKALEMLIPSSPRYLDKTYDEQTMVDRWNLVVPDYVLNEGWKEF